MLLGITLVLLLWTQAVLAARAGARASLVALGVVWGVVVVGSIDNFLRPKLVGSRTRLHELLIFFAVLGGLNVFGVLGVVLGPVVIAITLALIDVYRAAGRSGNATGTL